MLGQNRAAADTMPVGMEAKAASVQDKARPPQMALALYSLNLADDEKQS